MDAAAHPSLPAIPLIDVGRGGPLAVLEAERARFDDLFQAGRDHYGGPVLAIGDRVTRAWLAACATPYRADLEACAGATRMAGVYLMNLSYEWSCTTAVGAPPSGRGNRLLRTLDWPLDGLGRNVVVARHESDAGPWFNVTWPGFVGAATAMAPGRFSIAINQPPLMRRTGVFALDWLAERVAVWRRRDLPPMHLVRRVCETCRTYDEAREALCRTPVAVAAVFSLSGTTAHQGCIIERTATGAWQREGRVAVANHWLAAPFRGRPRGIDSLARHALMDGCRDGVEDGFDWVAAPILNATTRLAVAANAAAGTLQVRGYEAGAPATEDFSLTA